MARLNWRLASTARLKLIRSSGAWSIAPAAFSTRPLATISSPAPRELQLPESQLAATWQMIDRFSAHDLTRLAPPLAEQFEALAADLQGTADYLLASLPR